jgi:histidyl-tRNA synthetase
MIEKIKGTQDFLDLRIFDYVVSTLSNHLALHHFRGINTPILEPVELFKRSLGLETDVVSKEMYTVCGTGDQSKEIICLRPEATASAMRAFLENNIEHNEVLPWKVFTYGPMFRHERPQKGRYRQFNQFNIELIGTDSIIHDIELLVLIERVLSEKFKLREYALLINFLGCPEDRKNYKTILKEFVEQHARNNSLCATCLQRKDTNIMRIFDCKNPDCQKIYKQAPVITDYLCDVCNQEWLFLQEQLKALSVSFSVAPHLVRGLDYYDKTVFEFVAFDTLGAQNSFCGGGRYNHLAEQLGSSVAVGAFGVGFGVERMMMLVEKDFKPLVCPLTVLMPLAAAQAPLALHLLDTITAAGIVCRLIEPDGSIKSMMRKANKLQAQTVVLIGQEELETGTVMVKNMADGTQEKIKQADLVSRLCL